MTGGSPAASPETSSYEFQTREDPTSCIKAAPLIKLGQKYWNNHFSYGTLLCMLLIHSSCNIDMLGMYIVTFHVRQLLKVMVTGAAQHPGRGS